MHNTRCSSVLQLRDHRTVSCPLPRSHLPRIAAGLTAIATPRRGSELDAALLGTGQQRRASDGLANMASVESLRLLEPWAMVVAICWQPSRVPD